MDLIMAEYAPRAQCLGPGTFPSSTSKLEACVQIIEFMDVSRWSTVFGPAADPATQFTTPHTIIAGEAIYLFLVYGFAYRLTL